MTINTFSFPDIRPPITNIQEQNPQQRVPRSTVQTAQPNAGNAPEAASATQTAATHTTPTLSDETHAEQSKSSISWVNYQHGVNLAEAIEPGSSKRMTRNELMAYPGKLMSESVTSEQTLLIAGTRVGPALEWAVANGILVQNTQYTQKDIDTALSAVDQHMEQMEKALNSLTAPHPMRKDYYTHSEIYTAHDIENKSEQYKKYPVAVYDEKKFHDDFKSDLQDKKTAYANVIAQVLSTLSVEDRATINTGQVNVYGLTPAGPEVEPERGVFLLEVVNNGKRTSYEVNTLLGTACRRANYNGVFSGAAVIGKKRSPDGTEANEFTVWDRPNIQSPKYRPKAERQEGQSPSNEPFHSSLYVLKPLGVLPKPDANKNEQSSPNTLISNRFNDIGAMVSDKLFYVNEDALLELAKDDPARVTPQEEKDRAYVKKFDERRKVIGEFLKGFVPFWNALDAFVAGRPLEGIAQMLIDVLSFVAPVGKVVNGVVKFATRVFKSVLPKFAKVSKQFASYSFKPGTTGVKWEGGVQGVKWTKNTSSNVSKAVEQFRANATPMSKTHSPVREIEFNGAKYFVAEKPDAGDGVHYLLRVPDPKDPTKLVSSSIVGGPDEAGTWTRRGVSGGKREKPGKAPQSTTPTNGVNRPLANHQNWQPILDSGMYKGQPVYIHYTSKEGAEAIARELAINDLARGQTRAGAKGGVYVNPANQQFNSENVENLLFLGNERYVGRGDYMVIFSTDQVPTNLGPVTAGSPFVELKMPREIKLTPSNILYSGPNTFPNYFG